MREHDYKPCHYDFEKVIMANVDGRRQRGMPGFWRPSVRPIRVSKRGHSIQPTADPSEERTFDWRSGAWQKRLCIQDQVDYARSTKFSGSIHSRGPIAFFHHAGWGIQRTD